jgi:hypothetical protein
VSLAFPVNIAVIIIRLIYLFAFRVIVIRFDVPVLNCLDPFLTAFTFTTLQETTFYMVRATWQIVLCMQATREFSTQNAE